MATAAAVSGPDWTDILTAIGTVAAAVAAVGIAWWSHLQARKDRKRDRDREQFTQANAVEVALGETTGPGQYLPKPSSLKVVAVVVNRGFYPIRGVDVRFCYNGEDLVPYGEYRRVSGFHNLPEGLIRDVDTSRPRAMYGVLSPWDTGIRFESYEVPVQQLRNPYAAVRWVDQWGTRWEHKVGVVRRIRDDEPWEP